VTAAPLRPVERIGAHHDVEAFDSGAAELDEWLRKWARPEQAAGASVSYVACRRDEVVGYYSVTPTSLEPSVAPERLRKGQPASRPVPLLLLARFAVDRREQGGGLGKGLLRDAVYRMAAAAEEVGGRAIVVDARDDSAAKFYRRHGFVPAEENPYRLFRLMKDVRASIAGAGR
jgi:predicted N-acetyltransferase YhbS